MERQAHLPVAARVRRTAATVVVLGLLFGLLYGKALPCMFARVTHHPCPGCGSTRACVALLHGDLGEVFHNNPLGPVVALLLGILGVQTLLSVMIHGDFRGTGEGRFGVLIKRGVILVAALEILLWIARFMGLLGGPVPV